MKVFLISQGLQIEDQRGFDSALQNATVKGEKIDLYNLPYLGYVAEYGYDELYEEIIRINGEFKPDLVFFQFFHFGDGGRSPVDCIVKLKEADNHPLIFGSMGDLFEVGWRGWFARQMPRCLGYLAASCDAFFSTSMGCVAKELVKFGAKNVVFLPHAFNLDHFRFQPVSDVAERMYDVTMVGSPGRLIPNPFKIYRWLMNTCRRYITAYSLKSAFGARFRLFGNNWKFGLSQGYLNFDDQIKIFTESRVVVDAPAPTTATTYYASDRPFFIAGSGVPLVMRYTPRFEKIFMPGIHVHFANHITGLLNVCKHVLSEPQDVILEHCRQTVELVSTRHTMANRMDTLLSVYEAIKDIRAGRISLKEGLEHLRLWHFLPDIDLNEERKYAIVNWVG